VRDAPTWLLIVFIPPPQSFPVRRVISEPCDAYSALLAPSVFATRHFPSGSSHARHNYEDKFAFVDTTPDKTFPRSSAMSLAGPIFEELRKSEGS
jgi:hypothetical protein